MCEYFMTEESSSLPFDDFFGTVSRIPDPATPSIGRRAFRRRPFARWYHSFVRKERDGVVVLKHDVLSQIKSINRRAEKGLSRKREMFQRELKEKNAGSRFDIYSHTQQ